MTSSVLRQPAQEPAMQTFATPAPITAILAVPAGRRDVKLAARVTAAYSDGVLRVTAPAANRVLGSSGAVEVTVQLPAGSAVQAKAASAQFTTEGPLGEVTFDSAQGTVRVEQAATPRRTVVDGDITVGRLGGDAQVRTARGDIRITEATRGTLTLRTETGAITIGAAAGVSGALDAGT